MFVLLWYIGKFIIVTITIILYLLTLTSRFMFNNICKHTEERKRLVVLKLSRSGLSMFFRLYESSYEKKKQKCMRTMRCNNIKSVTIQTINNF